MSSLENLREDESGKMYKSMITLGALFLQLAPTKFCRIASISGALTFMIDTEECLNITVTARHCKD